MPTSIEEALDQPLVTVVEADKKHGVFKIRLGELKTVITITLIFDDLTELWSFEQSHAIKTSWQAGPYHPSIHQSGHRGSVLMDAISGFTSFYRSAKSKGFKPEENWLREWR